MILSALFSETLALAKQRSARRWLFLALALASGVVALFPIGGIAWAAVLGAVLALVVFFDGHAGFGRTDTNYPRTIPALLISLALVGFILGFLAVMTLMAAGLGAFAIMTGSGFDFEAIGAAEDTDAAFAAAFEVYQQTLGWQVVMGMFLVALLLFFVAVARSLPVAAAAVIERRTVALEAFNWTRKQGLKLLIAAGVFIGLPLGAAVAAVALLGGYPGALLGGACVGLAIMGWACLAGASYRLLKPKSEQSNPTA